MLFKSLLLMCEKKDIWKIIIKIFIILIININKLIIGNSKELHEVVVKLFTL
jgi:hypothetical protein